MIYNIRSGSNGNASYIGTEKSGILIDCGISAKCITASLHEVGIHPGSINAILITHEHSDHINGLKVLGKQLNVPIYASEGTLDSMQEKNKLPENCKSYSLRAENSFFIGELEILPFEIPHDAAEPLAYRVFSKGYSASFVTDLGFFPKKIFDTVQGSDFLLIESNHDVEMLNTNTQYPLYLKKRILSKKGHLSNDTCAENVLKLCQQGSKHILLGHMSQNTNTYDIAYQTTLSTLTQANAEQNTDFTLHLARHDRHSKIYLLK